MECVSFTCSQCRSLRSLEGAPEKCKTFNCYACIRLRSFKGAPEECKNFRCTGCKRLEYSLEYFPRCKSVDLLVGGNNLLLFKLFKIIGHDVFYRSYKFKKNKIRFESILVTEYAKGFDFKIYIKPLLKNKSLSEKEFESKYRGIISGEKYIF